MEIPHTLRAYGYESLFTNISSFRLTKNFMTTRSMKRITHIHAEYEIKVFIWIFYKENLFLFFKRGRGRENRNGKIYRIGLVKNHKVTPRWSSLLLHCWNSRRDNSFFIDSVFVPRKYVIQNRLQASDDIVPEKRLKLYLLKRHCT